MPRRAVYFTNVVPFPPNSGIERRCADVLDGLRSLGYRTTIVTAARYNPDDWTRAAAGRLRGREVDDVRLHASTGRALATRVARRGWRTVRQLWDRSPEPLVSPGMRRWFSRQVDLVEPDLILMTYSRWDRLLDHDRFAAVRRVVDPTDLQTLNYKMWDAIDPRLPAGRIDPAAVDPELLRPDFFDRLGLSADDEEFAVYDQYDATLTVSPGEDAETRRRTRRTRVVFAPITHAVVPLANAWDGPALMTTGPNPFNVQGYLLFAQRVLPLVRRSVPDFRLTVTGYVCTRANAVDGVDMAGRLPSLRDAFASARLFACPVFGGTGQQVKVVEAMAHGVPPVVFRQAALNGPVVDGVNGLVADDAETFAGHVARLWADPALRRRLGEAARATVAEQLSAERLTTALSEAAGLSSR